jgi:hypothetical protein
MAKRSHEKEKSGEKRRSPNLTNTFVRLPGSRFRTVAQAARLRYGPEFAP